MTSAVRFNMARQLLVDFKLIPTPLLDFHVAVNFGETAPVNHNA